VPPGWIHSLPLPMPLPLPLPLPLPMPLPLALPLPWPLPLPLAFASGCLPLSGSSHSRAQPPFVSRLVVLRAQRLRALCERSLRASGERVAFRDSQSPACLRLVGGGMPISPSRFVSSRRVWFGFFGLSVIHPLGVIATSIEGTAVLGGRSRKTN
jgi:hypothetical protein